MNLEIIIGLETHIKLLAKLKMFSNGKSCFQDKPNSDIDNIDIALPGTLPVLNKNIIQKAINFGVSLQGNISKYCIFSRKNYFYPDLPKSYQISQFENPIMQGGYISYFIKNKKYKVFLERANLEEDAGKLIHKNLSFGKFEATGIDFNRSGVTLLEVVTKPNIKSINQATKYLNNLYNLVIYMGICDGNIQKGSFRTDINISTRFCKNNSFSSKVEIKNINSFNFLRKAISYEIIRQKKIIRCGRQIVQETRYYNSKNNKTYKMRSKENSHDYRYFFEPDIPYISVKKKNINSNNKNVSVFSDYIYSKLKIYDIRINFLIKNCDNLIFFKQISKYFKLKEFKKISNYLINIINSFDIRFNLENRKEKIPLFLFLNFTDIILKKNISKKKLNENFNKLLNKKYRKEIYISNKHEFVNIINNKTKNIIIKNQLRFNKIIIKKYLNGNKKAFNFIFGKIINYSNITNINELNILFKKKIVDIT